MKNLLPIGRFSRVSRLTVKALRHYEEVDLLRPALVDQESGYRYYSLSQAAEAERIRLLRALEMPIDEVREVMRERDAEAVRALLQRHQQRIEARIGEYRRILDSLNNLMEKKEITMQYEIKIRQTAAQPVLGLRARTSLAEIGQLIGRAMGEIFGHLGRAGARPAGPPMTLYHDHEFKEEDMDVEICVPVDRPLAGSATLNGRELPGGPVASTLHCGPYDQIGPAYQALMTWIQEHGHETDGPPREVYLVGPDKAQDPAGYRTELQWPLRGA